MKPTPLDPIDAAMDSVLRASGSSLKNYTMPNTLADMREAMRKVMSRSYIDGSNACYRAINGAGNAILSGLPLGKD
jgi:hypothetical protein